LSAETAQLTVATIKDIEASADVYYIQNSRHTHRKIGRERGVGGENNKTPKEYTVKGIQILYNASVCFIIKLRLTVL